LVFFICRASKQLLACLIFAQNRHSRDAYHVFLQAGIIAQGLMQYLAVAYPQAIWKSFGSWLRTLRPGVAPSEFVVSEALRQSLPEFLLSSENTHAFAKFIIERQDLEEPEMFQIAA
jgi:hypothetical protein